MAVPPQTTLPIYDSLNDSLNARVEENMRDLDRRMDQIRHTDQIRRMDQIVDTRLRNSVTSASISGDIGIGIASADLIGSASPTYSPNQERLYNDMYVQRFPTTLGTTTTSRADLTVVVQDKNGDTITMSVYDIAQDNIDLQTQVEGLESRLYKLEEKIRFLTEI